MNAIDLPIGKSRHWYIHLEPTKEKQLSQIREEVILVLIWL